MISLGWYFWVVATLTLISLMQDVASTLRYARQENVALPLFTPTAIGLAWCTYHVLEAAYS